MSDPDQLTAEERYKRLSAMGKPIPGMKAAIEKARLEEDTDTEPTDPENEELDRLEAEIQQEVEDIDQQGNTAAGQNMGNTVPPPGPVDDNLPDHVKQMIDGISARLDPKFNMINDNISNIGTRVEVLENRVVKNNEAFKKVGDYAIKSRNVIKDNRRKVKNLEVKVDNSVKELNQRFNQMEENFSEKMSEIDDIIRRYEEGGFGDFSDLERPTRKTSTIS